jgi:hypothetical protein
LKYPRQTIALVLTFSASQRIIVQVEARAGTRLMSKEKQRYYLLPGMGGSALRRKRKLILQWSIAAGLCVSAIVAGLLYLLYTAQHRM